MKTPEEILKYHIEETNEPNFTQSCINAMQEYADQCVQRLAASKQTLLDEVNRLNAHIDELEKYYDSLRDYPNTNTHVSSANKPEPSS